MQNRLFRTVCTSFRVFALGALVLGVVGCQNASDTLVNPLPPSVPGAANPVFNLTGTWSGTLSGEDGEQIPVTWTASQFGESVEGPLVVATDEGEIIVAVAGVITGGDMAFTISVGAFPTAPTCSAFGSGRSALTDSEISANVDVSYSVECIGVVSSEPSESLHLSLSRNPLPSHAQRKK